MHKKRIQALEMRLNFYHLDHIANEELHVCEQIRDAFGFHDDLLTMVKKRKLMFDHISRFSGIANTILQYTVERTRPEP